LAEEILRGTFKEGSSIIVKHVENTEEMIFIAEEPDPLKEKEKTDSGEI